MSFFEELKRRNVIRVGIAYVIVAWLILQFADVVLNNIEAPGWVFQVIMLVLGIGLPLALFFAWAFEMTPEGIKKEKDIDRSESITQVTGQKLNLTIIGLLVVALGYFIWQSQKGSEPFSEDIAEQATNTEEKRALTPDMPTTDTPAVEQEPSIAVLPFVNMSADPEQEYFSDGISEEILNVLVRVNGLKVASRTSSFTYKGENLNIPEIARELKVGNIVEGSVRKSGNRVRITAQLINTGDDRHLWSDTYDRELTDIFAIQDEIANAIVAALSAELGILQETRNISVATATDNLDAYELYLKARGLFLAREQLEESIALYERAVELDPAFVRAWEGLAAVYIVVESWNITGRDWETLAMKAAERALELDPGLSSPWAVKGQIAIDNGDYISGMKNLNRSIELDPDNPTNYLWRGIHYSELGFQNESIADIKHCLELDPAYELCRTQLGLTYAITNEDELAVSLFGQSAERAFTGAQYEYIQRFMSLGERLVTAMVLLTEFDKDSTFPATAVLDAMEFPQRDHSRGLAKVLNWLDTSGLSTADQPVLMAVFKAYHLAEPKRFENRWTWLKENTDFRASKYFVPYMDKVGAPSYWREKGFPPGCRPLAGDDFECD
jgi:TolB-like protein